MLKKTFFITSLAIVIIITTLVLVLAYESKIEETSEKIFQNYFQEKIKSLSPEQQEKFEQFQELSIIDKFLTVSENQNANQNIDSYINKNIEIVEDKNE